MRGIFTPSDGISLSAEQPALRERLNVLYTREYRIANDWNIVIKNIFR